MRGALAHEKPLQIAGTINAFSALMAEREGFRAMNAAAVEVYRAIRAEGTQKEVLDLMQTREELYALLHYYEYEQKLDRLYPKKK